MLIEYKMTSWYLVLYVNLYNNNKIVWNILRQRIEYNININRAQVSQTERNVRPFIVLHHLFLSVNTFGLLSPLSTIVPDYAGNFTNHSIILVLFCSEAFVWNCEKSIIWDPFRPFNSFQQRWEKTRKLTPKNAYIHWANALSATLHYPNYNE